MEQEFHLVDVWTPSHVQTLLECLLDTFEENKVNAFTVLSALPQSYLYMQVGGSTHYRYICGSPVVECRTRNEVSPGSNPLCYRFEDWAFSFTMPQFTELYK